MGKKSRAQKNSPEPMNTDDTLAKNTDIPEADTVEEISDGSAFIDSLDELTADDIAPPPPPPTLGERLRKLMRPAVMVLCAIVFCASLYSLVTKLLHYKRASDVYGDLAGSIFDTDLSMRSDRFLSAMTPARKMEPMADYYTSLSRPGTDVDNEDYTYNVKFEQMRSNLIYLKSINPDIYGYIHIDGTRISFPIAKGQDNDFYLDHAYNKEYMVCGTIFADCYANDDFEKDRNTVFYGHNMLDGNMFNNVMLFKDEEIFNSKLIEIYTLDGVYTFEPFAIFQTVYNFPYFRMQFSSDEDFVAFCEEMQSKSVNNKNMTFTGEDKIITLSTCTPSDDVASYFVGRYALHAKLIKVER